MDMKDVRRDLYWIYLSQYTDRLRDLVITVMNLSVQMCGNFIRT